MAASPSRPVLPTDDKPGGSSRLSPATRRRPASVTATDGKAPAPLLAAGGTNPRLARGVGEPPASLHPPWWTGPSAPSQQTARATTAPRGPAPQAVQIKERRTENQQPSQGGLPHKERGEGPPTRRKSPDSAVLHGRRGAKARGRSAAPTVEPRSSAPSGAGLSRGAPQGALRGEAPTQRTETADSERRRTDARAANSACPPLGAARKGGEGRASPFPLWGKTERGHAPDGLSAPPRGTIAAPARRRGVGGGA